MAPQSDPRHGAPLPSESKELELKEPLTSSPAARLELQSPHSQSDLSVIGPCGQDARAVYQELVQLAEGGHHGDSAAVQEVLKRASAVHTSLLERVRALKTERGLARSGRYSFFVNHWCLSVVLRSRCAYLLGAAGAISNR